MARAKAREGVMQMGARGPAPKRSTERRRRNKDSKVETVVSLPLRIKPPAAKKTWTVAMRDWYIALTKSGQAHYYEPSDWAEARLWCDLMSQAMKSPRGVSAFLLTAFSAFSSRLLTTEGDRRRVRLEIDRGSDQPAPVTSLDAFRARAGA